MIIAAAGFGFHFHANSWSALKPQASSVAAFVGSETCAGCHKAEAKLWGVSQHKAGMQHATDKTVLGNFNDSSFDYYGVHSRFFRKNGKFLVETDGTDGKLAFFEVKYTFGIDPLQQYLVEFPDGRLQALPLAWDSRPQERGGQRWFHLYPDDAVKHDHVLHWTKLNQNWNFMCAECHSTGVTKNYDANTDRFATSWAEISVGCETCHGQGSGHAAWARDQRSWWPLGKGEDSSKGLLVRFDERRNVTWPIDPQTGVVRRSVAPAILRKEVETCGLCHARRASFHEDWVPGQWLSQTHVVEAIARDTYHADGQIRDVEEPYNYTPFKQSKMFAAGVTCSDCHDPHSSKLRVSGEGACLQCHAADKYADARHRHHASADRPPTCISCHMQARTYMVVDPRHDHSFRVPRPDLAAGLGTPNACNGCHSDKSPQWAATAVEEWFGPKREGFQVYAAAFHAARTDQADAAALLGVVARDQNAPAVARASALRELTSRVSPANIELARTGLADPDPMVRIGALDMLENLQAGRIWPLVSPLLADPVRGVRIRAASLLAADASVHHALGLTLTRLKRSDEALIEFRRGAELEPSDARYQYVYAVALHSSGQRDEAMTVLKEGLKSHPGNREILLALVSFSRMAGNATDALGYAEQLAAITPDDQSLAALIQELRRQTTKP